jgi:flagellar hook-associated protein 3 FlgL
MRISTQFSYDAGIDAIRRKQEELFKVQQQLSTGRRVLTPSDDPVSSSRAVVVAQAKASHEQFARNIEGAKSVLASASSALSAVSEVISDAKALATTAGNGALVDGDRASLAKELRGKFSALMGLANTQDGAGSYLFGGFREASEPFVGTPGSAVAYNGDAGGREVAVSASRNIPVTFNGGAIFQDVKNGNSVFATSSAAGNIGTGVIDAGRMVNQSAWSDTTYTIQFSVTAGVTTYDVLDATNGTVLSSGNPYVKGEAIGFSGAQVAISGDPANGDQFALAPSQNQSLFQTLSGLIGALETPRTDNVSRANLRNALNRAVVDLNQGAEQVLSTRTQAGAWERELDDLSAVNERAKIHSESELSTLQDLDYAKTISDFNKFTTILEAAQRTQAMMSRLSLFEFL